MFLRYSSLIAVFVATSLSLATAAERPNIVFICADDQAPWVTGYAGHPQAKTPNLDRLFREGAYLANAFTVTPVCSPSRAATMTGRYGTEVGITDWINHNGPEPDLGLDPKYVIWPHALSNAGYRAGFCGKWHLGQRPQFHPTNRGYHHFMGFLGGGTTPQNPTLEVASVTGKVEGYVVNLVTDDAIEFVRREKDKTFLLNLHFREPHAAYVPTPPEDWAQFKDLDPLVPNPEYPKLDVPFVKQKTREYLSSVTALDRNVGRLLAELDKLKLTDKTVVIFTSDHGYNIGHHGVWHKGNGAWILTETPPGTANIPTKMRPNMYDTSIRVPCSVRWPGVIKPGTVVTQTVTNLDWYRTILAIAGVELPPGQLVRGRNFFPLLKGEKLADWDNNLYGEFSVHHNAKTHMRMYRTSEWKLKRDFLNPDRDEMYDLKNDPGETMNLIDSSNPEIRRVRDELHQKILAKMREINDPVAKVAGQ